jgi:hypothetical protein
LSIENQLHGDLISNKLAVKFYYGILNVYFAALIVIVAVVTILQLIIFELALSIYTIKEFYF